MSSRSRWFVVLLAGVFVFAGGSWPPAARAEGNAASPPALRHGEHAVTEALDKPVSLRFAETPLVEVVDLLQSQCGIHVRLDRRALDEFDVASTVTRWGEPSPPVPVGGSSPPAEMKVEGHEDETVHVPPNTAGTWVDRPNMPAQQLAARMRVPVGRPVLVGGMTLDPTSETAEGSADGLRKQLYLFVCASIAGEQLP